jgi:hypothetical protein
MNREWLVPLVLGTVVAVGLYALPEHGKQGQPSDGGSTTASSSSGPAPVPDVLLPFAGATAVENRSTTFLVLAPHGKAAALAAVNRSTGPLGAFEWQSDKVALYGFEGAPSSCCAGRSYADGWPLPRVDVVPADSPGPRLLHDGYNATRVTAYVVDEAGLLLASNANDTARFVKHDDYLRLQSSAWYLGKNATAPNGTARLPGFAQPLVDRAMDQLDGLPVGGVASTRSNAYVALYGSLFVTIRVDELVYAP